MIYNYTTEGEVTWTVNNRLRKAIAHLPFVYEITTHGPYIPDDVLLIGYVGDGQGLHRNWFILPPLDGKLDILPSRVCIGRRTSPSLMRPGARAGGRIHYRRVPAWVTHTILTKGFNEKGLRCFSILRSWRRRKRLIRSSFMGLGRRASRGLVAAWLSVTDRINQFRR